MATPKGQALYKKAKTLIPGGTQLLSKRPEMFAPDQWPPYFERAVGVDVWDIDGNVYKDMGFHGIGACVLGYGDQDVDMAVVEAISKGSTSILNCPEEVELAEVLTDLHPWSDMARFQRSGGEAMTVAIRIGRAATQRDKIAFCGYHGWHDWYLSANIATGHNEKGLDGHLMPGLAPRGVPRQLGGTAFPFHYNKIEELEAIVASHGENLAVIVMEPIHGVYPEDNFLQKVRQIADKNGSVLIFDEITSGFRLGPIGAHMKLNCTPDIAVFAKSLGNGYPIGAVIGKRAVMDAAQTTFISSTAWTERVGPTASLATIKKYQKLNLQDHLEKMGGIMQDGMKKIAKKTGINLSVSGMKPLTFLSLGGEEPLVQKTYYIQSMLERGYLATLAFYACASHNEDNIYPFLGSVEEVFEEMAEHIKQGTLKSALKGPVCHGGFYRVSK